MGEHSLQTVLKLYGCIFSQKQNLRLQERPIIDLGYMSWTGGGYQQEAATGKEGTICHFHNWLSVTKRSRKMEMSCNHW